MQTVLQWQFIYISIERILQLCKKSSEINIQLLCCCCASSHLVMFASICLISLAKRSNKLVWQWCRIATQQQHLLLHPSLLEVEHKSWELWIIFKWWWLPSVYSTPIYWVITIGEIQFLKVEISSLHHAAVCRTSAVESDEKTLNLSQQHPSKTTHPSTHLNNPPLLCCCCFGLFYTRL